MIIPPTWNLPDAIKRRLGQTTYGRQRAIVEEGHLLLVLHKAPGPDDGTREGVLFWRTPAGEWQASRGASGAAAVKRHIQTYHDEEHRLTQAYEQVPGIAGLFDLLEALTPLVRAARNMHEAVQAAREAIPGDAAMIEARDLAYEVSRNLDLLLEDTRNAVQYRTAREAEAQAKLGQEALRASHRLNTLAAMFFPLTAMASVFGMNFGHGLPTNQPAIFWAVFAVGVSLGFFMKSWVVRRAEVPAKK